MVKRKKNKIDYCLVGEPTNPNILGEMIKSGKERKSKWRNNN